MGTAEMRTPRKHQLQRRQRQQQHQHQHQHQHQKKLPNQTNLPPTRQKSQNYSNAPIRSIVFDTSTILLLFLIAISSNTVLPHCHCYLLPLPPSITSSNVFHSTSNSN